MSASHVFVVDAAFKRTQIKVTPGRYMREVLEEACKAKKLDPEAYSLKTQSNKIVDLSQPFRLSGLSAGAKLQLTQASRSPSVVSVALQLPESEGGGRLSDKFTSTTSLWLILRKFEDAVAGQPARKLNLTQRGIPPSTTSGAGRLEYEQPVLNLMGRNLDTFVDLQKSLAQLGINSGSVLARLVFKSSGQPLDVALQEIDQYFRGADDATSGPVVATDTATSAQSKTSVPVEPEPALAKSLKPTLSNEQTATPENAEPDTTQSSQHTPTASSTPNSQPTNIVNGMSVFRPPTSSTPAAARQDDDPTTFEPSIDHAKAHQAALQRASRNQRLLSDQELADASAARRAQLATVTAVTVRVRYPDQSVVEIPALPAATTSAADLYARVMGTLAHAPEPFELKYTGPKGGLQTVPNTANRLLVRDLEFRGKVLVTLAWAADASLAARQGPSLKEEFRQRAQEMKVDLMAAAAEANATGGDEKKSVAEGVAATAASLNAAAGKARGDVEAKMKKFLGFGKK